MTKQEKILEGLEHCIGGGNGCYKCPYNKKNVGSCESLDLLMEDCLLLLKSQKPRVLALEELESIKSGTPVYIEERKSGGYDIFFQTNDKWTEFLSYTSTGSSFLNESYGIDWRVWNTAPTVKKRKETAWNA